VSMQAKRDALLADGSTFKLAPPDHASGGTSGSSDSKSSNSSLVSDSDPGLGSSDTSNALPTSQGSSFGRRLPNILTGLRMLVVPVFVVLLIDPSPRSSLWAAGIFIVASFTDWLDGYLARLYQAQSNFGTLMDPLADKVLVEAALVMLVAFPIGRNVPAWMVCVLLAREMAINGLRSLAIEQGIIVPSTRWAKHKTAWTMLGLSCLLIGEVYPIFGVLVDFHRSGMVFLWIALFFSVTTGVQYAYNLRRVIFG
jgi:CDP-diacylglycerol--glycerol-3-phosphate 3-phosphatidyltransferase